METFSESSLSDAQKEEVMEQIKQEVAIAAAQELLQNITEKCFKKCITKPGTSLDGSDKKCLAMCMDRFMDSYNLVSRTYTSRIQKDNQEQ